MAAREGGIKPRYLPFGAYIMQKFGLSQKTIRKYLTPGPGGGIGIGPDVLSAYAYPFDQDLTTLHKGISHGAVTGPVVFAHLGHDLVRRQPA